MPDISQYLSELQYAAHGAEVRDPIVNALNELNNGVTSAKNLKIGNTIYPATEFVLRTTYEELTNYDTYPIQGSEHAVTSNGLYEIFSAINMLLDNIIGTEEEDDS